MLRLAYKFKYLVILLVLQSLIATHFALTAPTAPSTVVPESFSTPQEQYLFFDQNFNVYQRLRTEEDLRNNVMTAEQKKPVGVNFYQIDINKLNNQLYLSRFIEDADRGKIITAENKLILPVLETDTVMNTYFRLKFGRPILKSVARKTLSRATYFVEPVGSVGGYFVKFIPHIPGVEQKLQREILINDYLKTQTPQLPVEMQNLLMDSYATVNFSMLGVPFAFAFRSADKILNHDSSARVYPGHGLLGCEECVQDYARKLTGIADAEKAVAKWKQDEYLPKLAKYLAYAHHVLGVSFEAHTQNFLLMINHKTGAVQNFFFRDFADVLLNPLPLLSEGRFPVAIDWQSTRLVSIHPSYFSDPGVQIARDIWYHVSLYSGQAVTSHVPGFKRQQRYLSTFVSHYIQQTEQITGLSVFSNLSEDALKVMKSLDERTSRDSFYAGELKERSPLRNALASVLKSVFDITHKSNISKIQTLLLSNKNTQSLDELKTEFKKAAQEQRMIYFTESARDQIVGVINSNSWLQSTIRAYTGIGIGASVQMDQLDFKFYNGRIWAVDRITQIPVAATLDVCGLLLEGALP